MNKVVIFVLGSALFLTGCFSEPTFDLSSESSYKESLAVVRAALPDNIKNRLEPSLMSLMFAEVAPSENAFKKLAQLASYSSNPEALLQKLAPLIEGKTGAEVIRIADEKSVSRFERQLETIDSEIASLREQITLAEQNTRTAKTELRKIRLSGARYWWSKENYLERPVIDFKITNSSQTPISLIYVHGILETPGRSVPWVKDSFRYMFKGGLEPGEKQDLSLLPNMFGEWALKELKNRNDLVLTLELINYEDANGNKLVSTTKVDISEKRSRIDRLSKSRGELGQKLLETKTSLTSNSG